jgi:hypothetical protein
LLRRQQHGALAGKSGFHYNNNATFPEGSGFGNLHRSDQWRAARPHGQFNVFEKKRPCTLDDRFVNHSEQPRNRLPLLALIRF